MTLFQALRILLRNKEVKENIAWAFHGFHSSTRHDGLRYFEDCADRWFNHSISVTDIDEVHRAEQKSKAFSFMRGWLEGGSTIWVKQSTLDKYHV